MFSHARNQQPINFVGQPIRVDFDPEPSFVSNLFGRRYDCFEDLAKKSCLTFLSSISALSPTKTYNISIIFII